MKTFDLGNFIISRDTNSITIKIGVIIASPGKGPFLAKDCIKIPDELMLGNYIETRLLERSIQAPMERLDGLDESGGIIYWFLYDTDGGECPIEYLL